MASSKTQTSFNLKLHTIKKKISISSKNDISGRTPYLLKELGLSEDQELFQKYLDKRIRKEFGSKEKMIKSCDSYAKFEMELTHKIKQACEGNISKAITKDHLEECDEYEI